MALGEQENEKIAPLTLTQLAQAWLRVGIQSFGGGAVSLELIRREFCERHPVYTSVGFAKLWAICQITPGVNQLALAVAIGRQQRGLLGIVVSVFAFLAPSVTITILLAWGYARIQGLKETQQALSVVVPATAGLGIATSLKMFFPLAKQTPIAGTALLIAVAILAVVLGLPVFAVLIGGGLIGAAGFLLTQKK